MREDVAEYVANCYTCQQVKAERKKSAGALQPLPTPEWKWEQISMVFIASLPKWVIMDRLTTSAHFLPVKTTYTVDTFERIYILEIVRLHGIPVSIVSNRESSFTSRFWNNLHKALDFNSAYHPQTDGQTERVNQVLKDMLRACVLDFQGSWEEHLSLVEFAYNNSYHSIIGMASYEALYGRPCRSLLCWAEPEDGLLLGPNLVRETTEKISVIRDCILAAQSRRKSYTDRSEDLWSLRLETS